MASLLYPDEDQSQWPTSLLPMDDGTPPVLRADPRADALGQTYRDVSDYLARQQAKSEAEGYWTGGGLLEGGHPTQKGLLDAIQQTGTAVALGTGAPGDAPPPSFTAYHGSPHDFPPTARNPLGEFDPAKIGTGEGSQAFGVGAGYTADAEAVAREYKDPGVAFRVGGKPINEALNNSLDDPAKSLALATLDRSDNLFAAQTKLNNYAGFDREYRAARDWLEANKDTITSDPLGGHMYEVKINADPEHFLDWDTPMARQSDHVVNALKQANGIAPEADLPASIANMTGQQLYEKLSKAVGGQHQASSILQDKYGIPGIRYLDAGSRGVGEGSRNSVVFDAATMEIIRKYGLAGLMAGGGAAALSGQQGQQQQ